MPTGSTIVNLYAKKLLPLDMVKDAWFDYIDERMTDVHARVFPDDGSYLTQTTVLSTGLVDGVKITAAFAAASGEGHTIEFGAADPLLANILFENVLGTVYHIGLRYCRVPSLNIEINPRTGYKEYVSYEESVGNTGDPDTVVDLGGSIRFNVDTITEAGVSHVGRTVRVWLKSPVTDIVPVAFEDCAVQWDGLNNYIVTAATLGQTAVDPATASYTVHELGATLQRLASGDLRTTPGVFFLAKITGTGPGAVVPAPSIDHTDQNIILWSVSGWLQITRVDVHGYTKVQVTGDPFDVNEDQIRVRSNALATVFSVTEKGDVLIDGVTTYPNAGPVGTTLEQVTFPYLSFVGTNPGGDAVGFMAAGGGLKMDVVIQGNVYLADATALIDAITFGGAPIQFRDIYTITPVTLSNTDAILGGAPRYGLPDIVGSINEGQAIDDQSTAPGVVYGLDPSFGGSQVTIQAGAAYGFYNHAVQLGHAGQLWQLSAPFIVDLVGQPAGFYYVYLDVQAGSIQFVAAAGITTAYADGTIPLCWAYFDGANITTLTDLRCFMSNGTRSYLATVGPDVLTGTFRRAHNFTTLEAALAWATDVWGFLLTFGMADIYGPIEVRINGPITVTQSAIINSKGLRLTSSTPTSECAVQWGFNGPAVIVNADDVTIDGLYFDFRGAGLDALSCAVQLAKFGGTSDLTVRNCRCVSGIGPSGGVNSFIEVQAGSPATRLTVEHNYVRVYNPSGLGFEYMLIGYDSVANARIYDNTFIGDATPTNCFGLVFTQPSGYMEIEGNDFSYLDYAIWVFGAGTLSSSMISDNRFTNIEHGGVLVSTLSTALNIFDNHFGPGCTTVDAPVLDLIVRESVIRGNFFDLPSQPGFVQPAIYLRTVAAERNMVVGNVMKDVNVGIYSDAPGTMVFNNFIKPANQYGVWLASTAFESQINGNKIEEWAAGFQAIICDAQEVTINNNHLKALAGQGTWAIYLTATATDVVIVGNYIDVEDSDAVNSACGIYVAGADRVNISGNYLNNIGDATNGGVGVLVTGSLGIVIDANTFVDTNGYAVAITSSVTDFVVVGNTVLSAGLAAVVNPLTGAVSLDAIFVAGQDGSVSSNTVRACAVGGWAVSLTALSAAVVGQLNHKNAGLPGAGCLTDAGAGNLVGANAVNNNL